MFQGKWMCFGEEYSAGQAKLTSLIVPKIDYFVLGKWTSESFSERLKTSKTDLAGLFPWFSGWNDFLG